MDSATISQVGINHELSIDDSVAQCPVNHSSTSRALKIDDELIFKNFKLAYSHYSTDKNGSPQFNIYCDDKEITFDEPELFTFGEQIVRQEKFTAGSAIQWGIGYEWETVKGLLEQLLEEKLLFYPETAPQETITATGPRPSPLPVKESQTPRSWYLECEALMQELASRPVELGYLEAVVPIFRVAHMTLDCEGRQVGEANVVPDLFRLDIPTEWRSCPHTGSRYGHAKPMNVTALKSMRCHWPQMMAVLLKIRAVYLKRFGLSGDSWTLGYLLGDCTLGKLSRCHV